MPTRALVNLEHLKDRYEAGSAARKLALLRALEHARLGSAHQVRRLHEALCFLRAYPDDARVAAQVERMLRRFARRADLRAHRDALADTGIAGTAIRYAFFWPTARWLAALARKFSPRPQRRRGESQHRRRAATARDTGRGAMAARAGTSRLRGA